MVARFVPDKNRNKIKWSTLQNDFKDKKTFIQRHIIIHLYKRQFLKKNRGQYFKGTSYVPLKISSEKLITDI